MAKWMFDMSNHPGRQKRWHGPDPVLIRTIRDGVLQTQVQAASIVHVTERTWRDWEAGQRPMPLVAWQVFILHHCLPGGMLSPAQFAQWLRPEWMKLLGYHTMSATRHHPQ